MIRRLSASLIRADPPIARFPDPPVARFPRCKDEKLDPAPGRHIVVNGMKVGRYRIAAKLGEGAVGSVYRALDTRMGRIVALKFLHPRHDGSAALRARFRREGLIGASLSHPNICTVHDCDVHEGRPFIVMEFLRGKPLSDRLQAGPLPTARLIRVAAHLAAALAKAHRSGVVHRDIKPANVFITDEGCTKLLDFGVAKPAEMIRPVRPEELTDPGSNTANGRLVGTMSYMSPEQARGERLDGRSDLFSLGVLLYEAATGVHPFDAPTTALVFDRIFNATPASPLIHNPSLPAELVRVIYWSLAKKREHRPARAEEILDALFYLTTDATPDADAPSCSKQPLAASGGG